MRVSNAIQTKARAQVLNKHPMSTHLNQHIQSKDAKAYAFLNSALYFS
ncbi:hypothetical protein HMPREF0091_10191 [Fannyhessea vaginae DSM 15829]|uniref:Uncharacterized protein n=1 Tax=Fannyhessea vaginae DSM 15829 TaxID=525256 RepID=F1T5W0_9ACTN|nr:hypothetical protein HMPREF0091_10191 [Fannyhessea vaginae DSM 15829]